MTAAEWVQGDAASTITGDGGRGGRTRVFPRRLAGWGRSLSAAGVRLDRLDNFTLLPLLYFA